MYKVLTNFREKEHDNTTYRKGDVYPKQGYRSNKKRVTYLQTENEKYNKAIFLGDEIIETKKNDAK